MSGNNSTPNNGDWVRLNVGGKTFQTSKDTLSRYPESFLACLVNGVFPSDKDETGAFLIDRDPKHFRVILNHLRDGELLMDRKEIALKELLREANFYGLHALLEEINKLISSASNRSEAIHLFASYNNNARFDVHIFCSEQGKDYKVLRALRNKYKGNIQGAAGRYHLYDYYNHPKKEDECLSADKQAEFEMVLLSYGFVQESFEDNYHQTSRGCRIKCWKFVRTVSN